MTYNPFGNQMNPTDLFTAQSLGLQSQSGGMPFPMMPQSQPGPQNVQMPPEINHLNDVINQYIGNKQDQSSNPTMAQNILTQRFQPTMGDTSTAMNQTAQSYLVPDQYRPVTPEQIAQTRATQELAPYTQGLDMQSKQAQIGLQEAQANFFNLGGQAANKPEPVFDPSLNNGSGGFRFATPIETRTNTNLQPASTVPAAAHQIGVSPTGDPISAAGADIDKKTLEALNNQTLGSMKGGDPALAVNNLITLLQKYPHLNSASGGISAANQYIPGFNLPQMMGNIPPDDYKQILANVGELKGVAMTNRTNIRNVREFNAITAPADIFGGSQGSAESQAYALGAGALQSKAYTQFKNAYFDKYNTLQGSDELWQNYIGSHEPVTRDQNQNITGINTQSVSPSGWMPLIQQAPQLLQQIRSSAPAQQPSSDQPSAGGGKVINFSDLPQ